MRLQDVGETVAEVECTVDPEFQQALRDLTDEERTNLEESIENAGRIIEPIKVWGANNTIIDGHHRYEIWLNLPEDTTVPPPAIERMDDQLETRDEAKAWVYRNQLGRRNLSPQEMSICRGELYNLRKANPHLNLKPFQDDDGAQNGQSGRSDNDSSQDAATATAKETKSTARTVRRDGKYVEALKHIGQVNPKAELDIRNGTLKVPKTTVQAIANLPTDEDIGKACGNLRHGRAWDHGLNGQPVESGNGQAETGDATPQEPPPKKEPPKDKEGHEIPERLLETFAATKEAESKLRQITKLTNEIIKLGIPTLQDGVITAAKNELRSVVNTCLPYSRCPFCKGTKKTCKKCESLGYLTKFQWKGVRKEDAV